MAKPLSEIFRNNSPFRTAEDFGLEILDDMVKSAEKKKLGNSALTCGMPQLYDFRGRKPERGGGNVTDLATSVSRDYAGSQGRIIG